MGDPRPLDAPMPERAQAVARRYDERLASLLHDAWREALSLKQGENDHQADNDALSIMAELAAIAGAKFILALTVHQADTTPSVVWTAAVLDLQRRMHANLEDYKGQMRTGQTVQ